MTPPVALPDDARLLVVNVARIGDTLLATPLLKALKKALPASRLTCWAHPKRIDALLGLPCIDQLTGLTKTGAGFRGWLAPLRGKSFDLALVLGHDVPLLKAAARLSRRVAAFGPNPDGLVTDPVREPAGVHAVDHRLALLAPFGIEGADKRLAWQITPAEAAWARQWLAERTPAPATGPLLGLQAASFPTKAYRDWPPGHFRVLLEQFFRRHRGGLAVLFGDAAGQRIAAEIGSAFGDRVAVLAGKASLRQSAAVMARCDAYVGVDTGPTHIAGALGLPMVALYHPLHPGANLAPLQHPTPLAVIEHPALASGDVPQHAAACMGDIPVDAVWAALERVLER